MIKPCKAIELDRLQMIKTEGEKEFRFGKVLLVKRKYLSKKMTAYDANSLKEIKEIKFFHEEEKKYMMIDIDSIRFEKGTTYTFDFVY